MQTALGPLYEVIEGKIKEATGEEFDFVQIIDGKLIFDVVKEGGMTEALTKRVKGLLEAACMSGADLAICSCSSVGAAVDEYKAEHPEAKLMRIDYPMAKYIVDHDAKKVAVMATLATTVDPSVDLIKRVAAEAGKEVEVKAATIEGAFDKMIAGDMDGANECVRATASSVSDVDVVVLAQASMARFMPILREVLGDEKVILDSPSTCAQYLADNWK